MLRRYTVIIRERGHLAHSGPRWTAVIASLALITLSLGCDPGGIATQLEDTLAATPDGAAAETSPPDDASSPTEADTSVADTTEDVAPPPASGPLRIGQGVGVYVGGDNPTPEEVAHIDVIKNHLDGVEILIGGDWRIRQWGTEGTLEERAVKEAEALASETRDWLEVLHERGMLGYVSIGWQGALPGVSSTEMASPKFAAYRFYKFDAATGTRYEEKGFDWYNPEARAFALGVFTDVSTLIGPTVDRLFINEIAYGQKSLAWHEAPIHSDAALADFKTFTGSDKGLPVDLSDLPEGVSLAEPERYNVNPTDEDWAAFAAWKLNNFKRKMELLVNGFAAGQANNPNYQGAVWFPQGQNVDIEGGELDAMLSIPEIKVVVPENLGPIGAEGALWQAWLTAAQAHGKEIGVFVPLSNLKAVKGEPNNYVPGITTKALDRLLEEAMASNVAMVVMYYSGSFDPNTAKSGDSYSPELVDIWDDWTHPDGPDADPVDWTVTDP